MTLPPLARALRFAHGQLEQQKQQSTTGRQQLQTKLSTASTIILSAIYRGGALTNPMPSCCNMRSKPPSQSTVFSSLSSHCPAPTCQHVPSTVGHSISPVAHIRREMVGQLTTGHVPVARHLHLVATAARQLRLDDTERRHEDDEHDGVHDVA